MAKSYPYFKEEVCEYLKKRNGRNARILDVGAGDGIYWELLHNFSDNIDAVEIFEPNIINYNLKDKYSNVYNADIRGLEYSYYDIIIFGDIIEHLTVEEAQEVLKYAYTKCKDLIVAVPYNFKQGIIDGNIYEIHKQDDLTPLVMQERYPFLKLLYGNEEYGYYVKEKAQ